MENHHQQGSEFLMADTDGASFSEIDKLEEMKSLQRVFDAYTDYRDSFEEDVLRWERSYHRLTPGHQALVPELPAKYSALRKCADQNAFLIDTMLQAFRAPFEPEEDEGFPEEEIDLGAEGLSERAGSLESAPKSGEAAATDKVLLENKVSATTSREKSEPNGHGQTGNLRSGEEASLSGQKRNMPEAGTSGRDVQGASMFKGAATGAETTASGRNKDAGPVHNHAGRGEPVHTHYDGAGPVHTHYDGAGPVHTHYDGAGPVRTHADSGEPVHTHAVGAGPVHTHADGSGPVHTHANGVSLAWGSGEHLRNQVPASDVEKVRCVLRNIVRDWTSEGATERSECYAPILAELQSCFPNRNSANPPSCVVPGAGLGRLACEISRLGFVCQGNEFSYYTLIVSSFILNMTDGPDEWTFYPWIHSQCNTQRDVDMLRPVKLPDLHPGSAGITEGFSMCAGDFLEVYGGRNQAGAWDSVVTCFFIDTAHNVTAYLEVIARILKPGGVWINFGPLLYHFADAHQYSQDDDLSVELSLETVLRIASSFGLTLKREPQTVSTSYTGNRKSMMTTRYQCAFWTMIKEG